MLHGTVQVLVVQHNERVGTAELQHDLLEVLARGGGHGGTCALRTGQRDTLHDRIRDHDVRDLITGSEDVDVDILRETRLVEKLLLHHGRLRNVTGVLEQDGVTQHQVGSRKTSHLVVREVPRHDAQQGTGGV